MSKKWIGICLFTFVIGCTGGGALAYANHQKGLESQSLLVSLSQTQNEWEVEQFIREQEEQRPEGLEESQIATGSRYTGITYNNVSVATVNTSNENVVTQESEPEEKKGLLQVLFGNKKAAESNLNSDGDEDDSKMQTLSEEKKEGRVVIQSGSLNIRAEASIEGDVIGQAYKDEFVEIVGQTGAWYQIITTSGLEGYASATYIEFVNK